MAGILKTVTGLSVVADILKTVTGLSVVAGILKTVNQFLLGILKTVNSLSVLGWHFEDCYWFVSSCLAFLRPLM